MLELKVYKIAKTDSAMDNKVEAFEINEIRLFALYILQVNIIARKIMLNAIRMPIIQ